MLNGDEVQKAASGFEVDEKVENARLALSSPGVRAEDAQVRGAVACGNVANGRNVRARE